MSRYIEAECEVEEKKKRKRLKKRILESDSEEGEVDGGIGDGAASSAKDVVGAELRDGDDHVSCAGSEDGGGSGMDQGELESDSASECSADLSEHESDRDFIDDGVVHEHDASGDELDKLEKACERKRMGMSRKELALQELEDGEVSEDDEFETVKALKMVRKMTSMAREKHRQNSSSKPMARIKTRVEVKGPTVSLKDILTMKAEMQEQKKKRAMEEAVPQPEKRKKKLAAGEGDWSRFFNSLQCSDDDRRCDTGRCDSGEIKGVAPELDATEEAPEDIKKDQKFQFIQESMERIRDASIKKNTEKLMPELEKERLKMQKKLQRPMVKPVKVGVKKEDDGKIKKQVPKCHSIESFFKLPA